MVKRRNQDRSEGLDGNEYKRMVADIEGLIWSSGHDFQDIADNAGLNVQTVSRLAHGETKRPQDRTIKAILKALGYRQAIVKVETEVVEEIKPSRNWRQQRGRDARWKKYKKK